MKPRSMLIRLFACALALFVIPGLILELYEYRFQPRQVAESTSQNGEHIVEVVQVGKTTLSSVSRLRVRVDREDVFTFAIRGDLMEGALHLPQLTWEDQNTLIVSFLGDENVLTFHISFTDTSMKVSWYEGRLHDEKFVKEPSESYRLKIISDSVEFLGYIPPTE